ncbi:MAG: NAD-dependent epimerase/dehydratase family protein [Sedimenticola sp.]
MYEVELGRCLVTGGTGFIGQRLLASIIFSGCSTLTLSRSPHPSVETIICDLVKDEIPIDALDSVDTVFHLAGYAHDLRYASKAEYLYRAVNVEATTRLAMLAVQCDVKRFVYVSSVKAGGTAVSGQCMTEEGQGEPEGIYGQTKREAELRLLEIGRQSGMHVSIVRPSLVYGAGVKGNLRMMLSGIDKGWFPPLPEVDNCRSMIHVDDLVKVLLLVAGDDRANGEIFIATDGELYSSRDIYDAMRDAVGGGATRWRVPNPLFFLVAKLGDLINGAISFPFDSHRYQKLLGDECFSSEKIQTLLGFKPSNTLFDVLPDMVAVLRKESGK